jgi:hypothetical protein
MIAPKSCHPIQYQPMLACLYVEALLAELYAATVLIDQDFADLPEDAFLDGMIDGKAEDLAYLWLSVNRVSEQ